MSFFELKQHLQKVKLQRKGVMEKQTENELFIKKMEAFMIQLLRRVIFKLRTADKNSN